MAAALGGAAAIAVALVLVFGAATAQGAALTVATGEVRLVAATVGSRLDEAAAHAANLRQAFEVLVAQDAPSRSFGDALLTRTVADNPALFGAWAAFEPDAFDGADAEHRNGPGTDHTGRYLSYLNRSTGTIALEPVVDYEPENPSSAYYQIPLSSGQSFVTEPTAYRIGGREMVVASFCEPVFEGDRVVGVVGVDLSFEDLSEQLRMQRPSDVETLALLTPQGRVVADALDAGPARSTRVWGTSTTSPPGSGSAAPGELATGATAEASLETEEFAALRLGQEWSSTGSSPGTPWRILVPVRAGPGGPTWSLAAALSGSSQELATAQARRAGLLALVLGAAGGALVTLALLRRGRATAPDPNAS